VHIYAVTADDVRTVKGPPGYVEFIAVDAHNKNHLRTVGGDGTFDSRNGGASWRNLGGVRWSTDRPRVVFAPHDLDHILMGPAFGAPMQVTRNAGRTWVRSTGPARAADLWFAPDGRVAWSFGSTFFRSEDGGASFAKVVTSVPLTPLFEGTDNVVLLGAQQDPDVFVVAAWDEASNFILRFDTKSLQSTRQTLPLDRGECPPRCRYEPRRSYERVSAATLVPGEAGALCLGIRTVPARSGREDDG
jgi:hypothetical protein